MYAAERGDTGDSSSDEFIDIKLNKQSATKGKWKSWKFLLSFSYTAQGSKKAILIPFEDTSSGEEAETG